MTAPAALSVAAPPSQPPLCLSLSFCLPASRPVPHANSFSLSVFQPAALSHMPIPSLFLSSSQPLCPTCQFLLSFCLQPPISALFCSQPRHPPSSLPRSPVPANSFSFYLNLRHFLHHPLSRHARQPAVSVFSVSIPAQPRNKTKKKQKSAIQPIHRLRAHVLTTSLILAHVLTLWWFLARVVCLCLCMYGPGKHYDLWTSSTASKRPSPDNHQGQSKIC
jgi:hypothetical protein